MTPTRWTKTKYCPLLSVAASRLLSMAATIGMRVYGGDDGTYEASGWSAKVLACLHTAQACILI
jgi:hypothetical protein